jgi:hypothetical protein
VQLHPGAWPLATLGARDRYVDGVRDDVSQVVQLQRALMRHDAAGGPEREPRRDNMLERTRREVAQPIDAATDAFVPAARARGGAACCDPSPPRVPGPR